MVYDSKVDWWLVALLVAGVSPAILPLFWTFDWVLFSIDVVVVLLLVEVFRNTKYEIDGEKLIVRTGFKLSTSCDVCQIKSVTKTRTLLSAPALSFDRLEIKLKGGEFIVVSPRKKQAFVEHLQSINPQIVVGIGESSKS